MKSAAELYENNLMHSTAKKNRMMNSLNGLRQAYTQEGGQDPAFHRMVEDLEDNLLYSKKGESAEVRSGLVVQ